MCPQLVAKTKYIDTLIKLLLTYFTYFVNLPTGFGKSLIYQALPLVYSCLQSTVEKNIIVVISPLTSLMKDQVMRLISLGITAISLAEITTQKQCNEVKNGDYSVVFGSPELWLGVEKMEEDGHE